MINMFNILDRAFCFGVFLMEQFKTARENIKHAQMQNFGFLDQLHFFPETEKGGALSSRRAVP
jgi:hypothetical protein